MTPLIVAGFTAYGIFIVAAHMKLYQQAKLIAQIYGHLTDLAKLNATLMVTLETMVKREGKQN